MTYYENILNDLQEHQDELVEELHNQDVDMTDTYEIIEELAEIANIDGITGSESGSYFFNREQAREFVEDNIDEVAEALGENFTQQGMYEFVGEMVLDGNWEQLDVQVREWTLLTVLDEFATEIVE